MSTAVGADPMEELGGVRTPYGGFQFANKAPMRLGVGGYYLFGFFAYGTLTVWFLLQGLASNPVMIYVFPYAVLFSVPILIALPRRKVDSVWVAPTGLAIVYGTKKELLPWTAFKGISEKKGVLGRSRYLMHLELPDAKTSDFKYVDLRVSANIAAALTAMEKRAHSPKFELELPYHLKQDLILMAIIMACFLSVLLIIPYFVYQSMITLALAITPLVVPFIGVLIWSKDDGRVTHIRSISIDNGRIRVRTNLGSRDIYRHQIRVILFPRFGRRHALLYTLIFPAPFRLSRKDALAIRDHFLQRSEPIVLL